MCWSTALAFGREQRAYERARRAQFVDHIGEYYGLEVEAPIEREPAGFLSGLLRRLPVPGRGSVHGAGSAPAPVPSGSDVDPGASGQTDGESALEDVDTGNPSSADTAVSGTSDPGSSPQRD
jgi:choline/glycine/proline betaine transport protein